MTTENRNDEIDLIEVFFNVFKFFKRNILILIVSTAVGAALGYSYKFISKEYYKSEMLMESYTISEELRTNYIKQFQNLLDDKNYETLSAKSGLKIEDLKMIKRISFETDGNKTDEDILFVNTQVWDTSVLPKLAEGIQSFMNSFPYVNDEIALFKENSQSFINDIEKYKENISSLISNVDVFVIDSVISTRNYYINELSKNEFFHNEVIDLIKEKQKIEKELNYALPFRVIKDFTVFKTPVNNNKGNTLKGAILFIFAALLVLIIIDINKRIS